MLSRSIRKISCRCSALDGNDRLFAAAPQFLGVWSGLRDVPFVFNCVDRGRSVQAVLSQFILSLQCERGFAGGEGTGIGAFRAMCQKNMRDFLDSPVSTYSVSGY